MFLLGNSSRTNSKLSYRFESHLFFRFAIDTMISFFFVLLYLCNIYNFWLCSSTQRHHGSYINLNILFHHTFCYVYVFRLFSVCLLLDFVSLQILYSVCLNHVFFDYLFELFILCLFDFSYVSLITNHSINLLGYFHFYFHSQITQSSICFLFQYTKQY